MQITKLPTINPFVLCFLVIFLLLLLSFILPILSFYPFAIYFIFINGFPLIFMYHHKTANNQYHYSSVSSFYSFHLFSFSFSILYVIFLPFHHIFLALLFLLSLHLPFLCFYEAGANTVWFYLFILSPFLCVILLLFSSIIFLSLHFPFLRFYEAGANTVSPSEIGPSFSTARFTPKKGVPDPNACKEI